MSKLGEINHIYTERDCYHLNIRGIMLAKITEHISILKRGSKMIDGSVKSSQASILIVDDTPENLELLSGLLKDYYQVRVANSGERAITIINSGKPPELILLDIMMPNMDGFMVCKHIKASAKTKDIPVIFISALSDVDNIVKSFTVGGVDYITKPFHFDEVYARVKTHLELRRAKAEVQLLLSNTLVGSVKFMMDLLALTQPLLVEQSIRLRRYAKGVVSYMKIPAQEAWRMELATMLLHIGCVMLPEEVVRKTISGELLMKDEQQLFEKQILAGTDLIAHIPRLDTVAELIRSYHMIAMNSIHMDHVDEHGIILKVLVEFDRLVMQGVKPLQAINKLAVEITGCPQAVFKALIVVSMEANNEE